MHKRSFIFGSTFESPGVSKFSIYLIFIFLITLSDAFLSYWTPIYIQDTLGNATKMGAIIAISSLVGLFADAYLPQVIRKIRIVRIMTVVATLSVLFITCLAISRIAPSIILLILAVALWGIYYELLAFTSALLITRISKQDSRTNYWGVLYAVRSTAYMIGPILASGILLSHNKILFYALLFTGLSLIPTLFMRIKPYSYHTETASDHHHNVSILREISHWRVLATRIWPIISLSLLLGLIDATFWTTGTVWSITLLERSFLGGLFLAAYSFPTLIAGLIFTKWKIAERKKFIAELCVLISGIFLICIGIFQSVAVIIIFTFLASLLLAIAYPLLDATYTDVTARMRGNKQHVIGLSYSTSSLAYIVGPIVAGVLTDRFSEQYTFLLIGILTVFASLILLALTPKKLKLPQKAIATWEE